MKKLILILTIIFCFNTTHSQFYNRETAPKIQNVKVDTITNVEAAGILLTRSGEIKNQAIKEFGIVGGTITVVNSAIWFSMNDYQIETGPEEFFIACSTLFGVGFGINSWMKTYKGNVYLQKAGRYLSNKGENSIEKIDGKYYYIKYISK